MLRLLQWLEASVETMPRLMFAFVAFIIALGLYFIPNHYPLNPGARLPFLRGEEFIPFLPWTAVIYLTAFPLVLGNFFLLPKQNLGRFATVGGVLLFLHVVAFWLFPVEYPRPPLSDDGILCYFRMIDTAYNCMPSLHVSGPLFLSLLLWRYRSRKYGIIAIVWTILIAATTLTTKQHYVLDVVASFVFTGIAYAAVKRYAKP